MKARWIERISGVAAGILGLAVIGFIAFGPVGNTATSTTTGSSSTGSVGLATADSGAIPFLVVLAVLLVAIALAALEHSVNGAVVWRAVLLATTVLLLLAVVFSIASVGMLLIPSLILAVVAGGFSFRRRPAIG